MVLFEAAELVSEGVVEDATLDRVRDAFSPEQIMIELPGPWISGVTLNDVFNMMVAVTRSFGADANIGNVAQDQVLNLEALRRSEERRVGKECVSTCRYWGAPEQ